MKKIVLLVSACVSLVANSALSQGVLITQFNEAISADSPWVWNSGNKTITAGTNTSAGALYPDETFSAIDIGSNTSIQLTLSSPVTTSPGGGFRVSLESTGGGLATAVFSYASFASATVGNSTFSTAGGFNPAQVINWNIFDGGSGSSGSLAMSVSELRVVPEPSTYALMALGGLALFFIARRRKAQV
jgi:hypothetical protein